MENHSVSRELNTLLKGEQMAVTSYEKFIEATDDESIKDKLQEIQQEHKEHAGKLAARIQDLGGKPDYGTGIIGLISNAKLKLATNNNRDTVDILKKAYDGEDKGIAAAEEVAKGDLDEESRNLVDGILSEDHDHLRSMLKMISEYGYKH